MDITEIQDELLRLEFPNLLPDHDPDIERYYYLRSIGQSHDALGIYQNRLVVRYPDNEFRTWLLRSYRSHDPAFRGLLARGYRMLGARSMERVKQILLIIAEKAESFNEKDVYSTIKAAEEMLRFLPPDRYEAVAGMERYLRYATVMDIKVKSIARATELIRAYMTDTLSVVEEERRRRLDARTRAEEENRKRLVQADWDSYYYQKKYGVHTPLIDLSSVVFSEEDLMRIEIPAYTRVEDQILGYCIKYWNNVNDPAFERILFLYSRKFGKKNYDVYMTIRRGQMAKRRDDEILSSITSVLVTGYYYSVQGDLYLQRNWNAIKHALANQGQQKALAASAPKALPAPAEKKPAGTKKAPVKKLPARSKPGAKQIETKPGYSAERTGISAQKVKKPAAKPVKFKQTKPVSVSKATAKQKPAAGEKIVPKIAPKPRSRAIPVIAPKAAAVKKPAAVVARPAEKLPQRQTTLTQQTLRSQDLQRPAVKPVTVPKKLKPAEQTKTTIVSGSAVQPKTAAPKPAAAPVKATGYKPAALKPKRKTRAFPGKTLSKAKGSVSDRLKELSGRSYDVYEDRFLAKARSSIRKVLGTGKGLFFTLPEEAEDLVYNFLRDHYSDPYMDWETSNDRKNLMTMGFDLPSINPVIDECYRNI